MIRFRKYKCTGKSPFLDDHFLAGLWDQDEKFQPCFACGKTLEETCTIWNSIYDVYLAVIPYEFRPKNVWYQLKCRFWKKYTTYKPRYLPHTWIDKDNILIHMNFEILSRFVEDELIPGPVDWDADEEHRQAKAKMLELYEWWKENHDVLEKWNEFTWEQEEQYEKLRRERCKEIIDLSPWFWT